MVSVSRINGNQSIYTQKVKNSPQNFTGNKYFEDSFEENSLDKSNNGKFDWSEAGKNFFKGLISPVTAACKHPIVTIGLVAGTIAACSFVPVLGPVLAIGFGAYSLYQVGKGCYDAAKNYNNGEFDAAEKSFTEVGEGTIGTVLSMLGIKQSAKIAQEAKLMSELNTTSLTSAQKIKISENVKIAGFFNNLKETLSLFATKSGIKATFRQFKPEMLKARFQAIKNLLNKSNYKNKTPQEKIQEFKNSPEGQRRAALTNEQIQTELEALYNDAFDRLGVPREQRPKLVVYAQEAKRGGGYNQGSHQINFNPEAYKSGIFEIEDVIMHEATHCKEAILRAGIPQDRVDSIIADELIGRIRNGETEKIMKDVNIVGADMAEPPKMSSAMREDFINFAKDNLFNKDNNLKNTLSNLDYQYYCAENRFKDFNPETLQNLEKAAAPIIDKLKLILKKNPDFVQQYGSEQKALTTLIEYSRAHNFRYNYFTDTKLNINVEPLTGNALAYAEQSLINNIATQEGNGRISGINIFGWTNEQFNQYQFSPEEVLAQKNGNNYAIEKMTAELNKMKEAGTLTPEREAYITKAIEKAKIIIEYKTKGLEYYKKYTQMINNPSDKQLAAEVKVLAEELELLKSQLNPNDVANLLNPDNYPSNQVPLVAIAKMLETIYKENFS